MDSLPSDAGHLLTLIAVLMVMLFLCALGECMMAAVETMSETKIKKLAEDGGKRAVRLLRLNSDSAKLFSSLRLSTVFFGFLASVIASFYCVNHLARSLADLGAGNQVSVIFTFLALLIVNLVIVFIYVVFCVHVTKGIAKRSAENVALNLTAYAAFTVSVSYPFVWIINKLSNVVLRLIGIRPKDLETDVTEEEIRLMVDIGSENGAIDDDEKQMIHNIFELDDKPVEDIMTHRTDVDILWINDGIDKWREFINETNHTRYPVCGGAVDDILGVLNSRDFYKMMMSGGSDIKALLRQPYFVPESIKADELFSQMQNKNAHFAVVLDEYGGFRGIVTQEDLLEEIVGELYSEYDEPEESEIEQIDENTWRVQGWAELDDVSAALELDLESEEYNTFAGMVLDELGTVPEDGATPELETNGLAIKVTSIVDHRIEEAIVCKVNPVQDDEEKEEE